MQNYLILIQNLPPISMIFRQFNLKFLKISHNLMEKSIVFLLILALIWQFAFPRLSSEAQTLDVNTLTEIKQEQFQAELGRMNARYAYRADIWMKTTADARQFGLKTLKMEIYQ
ncbi:MAG: hypothetical protein NT116_05845 [Candidatus Parcubacteria bacterium]|nr:hypothetical protein [Candidatus Parcubacteria bacterium]